MVFYELYKDLSIPTCNNSSLIAYSMDNNAGRESCYLDVSSVVVQSMINEDLS